MTYIEINGTRYPATIDGKKVDRDWNGRESKKITLEMPYADAAALFVDGLAWSIVMVEQFSEPQTDEDGNVVCDENGNPVIDTKEQESRYDNSAFCIAGDITDHRNGYVSVKMGMPTELEALQAQLANAVTEDELTKAYTEGVNSL